MEQTPLRLFILMTPGVGHWTAEVAMKMKMLWTAVIPFQKHYLPWPPVVRRDYHKLLKSAYTRAHVDREPNFIIPDAEPDIWQLSTGPRKVGLAVEWIKSHMDWSDRLLVSQARSRASNHVVKAWIPAPACNVDILHIHTPGKPFVEIATPDLSVSNPMEMDDLPF
jgi:hypothetical protein